MSTSSKSFPKTTLWVWPSGLFPRRLIYYLRAKGLTTTLLKQHNIHLIPVELNSTSLQSLPGYEARPADHSLPSLRIQHENGEEFWISETIAILEYFEELYPSSAGYPDLRGHTLEQRARTRDILNLTSDTSIWYMLNLMHTNASTNAWSGLTADQMDSAVAGYAGKKTHALLSRLENWVEKDSMVNGTASLSGKGVDVTLADIVLMAHVEYALMSYGIDALAEHGILRIWYERAKEMKCFITNDTLKKVDQGEGWSCVLGT